MEDENVQTNASMVRQGFGTEELAMQHETAATAIAAAAKAAIEARYILALKRPRDWDVVRSRLLKECGRPGFADAAIYKKPVGNKYNEETGRWEKSFVEGLSVRFAEAALRYMTNFYADATSIYDDAQKSIVRVTVMDLETNATVAIDVPVSKTVERSKLKDGQRPLAERMNSSGKRVFIVPATDDEVINKSNALVSKALRNGVLRLLPGDIADDCEEECRKVQLKRDAQDPEAAKKKLFDAFSSLGIMPDELKAYLGTSGATLEPKQLAELRAMYAAIRDGETTWRAIVDAKSDEAAPDSKPTATKAAVEDLAAKHAAKTAAKKKAEEKAEEKPVTETKSEPRERQPGED